MVGTASGQDRTETGHIKLCPGRLHAREGKGVAIQDREMTFGSWLRVQRKARDLTQESLARMVGCSEDTIRKIESGLRRPSRQVADLLADALDLHSPDREAFVTWARAVSPVISQSDGTTPGAIGFEEATETDEPGAVRNPYRGLHPFNEADAPYFCGREALVSRLLERFCEPGPFRRFLAMVGPSGSGKSSVVRAGLVPAIRREGLPGNLHPVIAVITPGSHPFQEVEAALLAVAANPSLFNQPSTDDRGLLRAAVRSLPEDPGTELLLVIDQFEEVFTLARNDAARELFFSNLYLAATDPRSRVWVVVVLRADFYDRPLLYPHMSELFGRRTEVVGPLSPSELHRAMAKPAEQAGLEVEEGLAVTIERDLARQPGSLPLLQYSLTELVERREGRRLTVKAYEESGGVPGALATRAEAVYASLDPQEQEEAKQLFLRLVNLGDGSEVTRRRVNRGELVSAAGNEAALDQALDSFGRYRLLTFDRDPAMGTPTVEVAHEALFGHWGRLRDWIDSAGETLSTHRRLLQMASDWEDAGRDSSFLASGTRLAQFQALLEDSRPAGISLAAEERGYLEASLALREREAVAARKRHLWVRGSVAATLLVLSALALVALVQAREASQQQALALSREVAAKALAEVKGNTMRALLLGIEASKIARTSEADEAVEEALLELHPPQILQNRAGNVGDGSDFDLSPDGTKLAISYEVLDSATGDRVAQLQIPGKRLIGDLEVPIKHVRYSPDGKLIAGNRINTRNAEIWNAASGAVLHTLQGHSSLVRTVAFSPDSRLLATGSDDKTARIWDVATGAPVCELRGHEGRINSAQFSPDSSQVVTASDDGTARVWDARTGKVIRVLQGHTDGVVWVDFSPGGEWIVTASEDGTARLWEASTGRTATVLAGHTNRVNSARFSPDGKWIATASDDGTTRLWDVGAVRTSIKGGSQPVARFTLESFSTQDAIFSADSKWVVTTRYDIQNANKRVVPWSTCVWEVATGRQIAPLHAENGNWGAGTASSIFSLDGKMVIMPVGDRLVESYLWELYQSADRLLEIAPKYATRRLTCEERQTYLHETLPCFSGETSTPQTTP